MQTNEGIVFIGDDDPFLIDGNRQHELIHEMLDHIVDHCRLEEGYISFSPYKTIRAMSIDSLRSEEAFRFYTLGRIIGELEYGKHKGPVLLGDFQTYVFVSIISKMTKEEQPCTKN